MMIEINLLNFRRGSRWRKERSIPATIQSQREDSGTVFMGTVEWAGPSASHLSGQPRLDALDVTSGEQLAAPLILTHIHRVQAIRVSRMQVLLHNDSSKRSCFLVITPDSKDYPLRQAVAIW
jgi:hypothetical protein